MADNKENNKWSRPPQPPPPPSSNPSSLVLWCREEGTLWEQGFCYVSFFFYHGALSLQLIHTGRNKTLLDSVIFMAFFYPQLLQGQKDGKCFEKFQEGELTFPPTYKYNPGTDQWDTER